MTTEKRMQDLEDKVTFLERDLAQLDEVIKTLHDKVDAIAEGLKMIKDEADRQRFLSEQRSLEDEKPPHY